MKWLLSALSLLFCLFPEAGAAGQFSNLKSAKQAYATFRAQNYDASRSCGLYFYNRMQQRRPSKNVQALYHFDHRIWRRKIPRCEVMVVTHVVTNLRARHTIDIGNVNMGNVLTPNITNIVVGKDMKARHVSIGTTKGANIRSLTTLINVDDIKGTGG